MKTKIIIQPKKIGQFPSHDMIWIFLISKLNGKQIAELEA